MTRARIQTLKQAGIGARAISQLTGASESTVLRVGAEPPVEDAAAADGEASARMGRPSKVTPFLARIAGWLEEDARVAGVTLIARLREEGYTGGKNAVPY